MLSSVILQNVLPKVFVGTKSGEDPSDLWLREVTFRRGESVLVEAASGRGKTSLCAFLTALREDFVGSIDYVADDGQKIRVASAELLRNHLAMLFQDCRLFPELTAVENVMLKNQLTDFTSEAAIRQQLERLDLGQCLDRPCATLSLGQQQRVAFVRALCQPCDFLLLDEPVSHLDAANAAVMADMVRERQTSDGIGLIVTSVGHRLPYAYQHILQL